MPKFLKGHSACAGCAPVLSVRTILDTLGEDIVVSLATGCMEVVSTQYPESAWPVPVIHSLFENVPSVATGISRALKVLGKKGKTVCIAGDGSTYDIGFGAMSGAMERNEDILYICYDNEAYAKTGYQRSGATPRFAATSTSPAEIEGKAQWKKSLPFIAASHAIPYVATASVAFMEDFKKKLLKAKEMSGFRLIVIQAPCVPAWKIDSSESISVARLAVQTGMWNLYEIEHGKFSMSVKAEKLKPVEEYLKMQSRFRHLKPEQTKMIQEHVIRTQEVLLNLEKNPVDFTYL